MRVFLGWSGDTSLQLAEKFRDLLKGIFRDIDPFLSSRDIASGEQWQQFLTTTLTHSDYGIFFLTRENYDNPWMHFEAGAMLKEVDQSRICPFLFDVASADIKGPFSMFQSARFTRDDVWKMVETLNNRSNGSHHLLNPNHLRKLFDDHWQNLEQQLREIRHSTDVQRGAILVEREQELLNLRQLATELLGHETIHLSGLRQVYQSRKDGCLQEMRDEIAKDAQEVVIIGSSLRGIIGVGGEGPNEVGSVRQAIMDALRRNVKIKMLLTHPKVAHHRSIQEGREQGEIEAEIIENLIYLTEMRCSNAAISDNLEVKLYNGTPTIFMLRTSRAMFFNPYPFYSKAFDSLCFVAHRDSDISRYYSNSHYEQAWGDGRLTEALAPRLGDAVEQLKDLIEGRTQHKRPVIPDTVTRQRLLSRLKKLESKGGLTTGCKQKTARESHSSKSKKVLKAAAGR